MNDLSLPNASVLASLSLPKTGRRLLVLFNPMAGRRHGGRFRHVLHLCAMLLFTLQQQLELLHSRAARAGRCCAVCRPRESALRPWRSRQRHRQGGVGGTLHLPRPLHRRSV